MDSEHGRGAVMQPHHRGAWSTPAAAEAELDPWVPAAYGLLADMLLGSVDGRCGER